MTAIGRPAAAPRWSPLRLGMAARLAVAGGIIALLWAAVLWAVA